MKNTLVCNLELSQRDLYYLVSALRASRQTKREILAFYNENSDAFQVTPLSVLEDEYDTLTRLIDIFSTLPEVSML